MSSDSEVLLGAVRDRLAAVASQAQDIRQWGQARARLADAVQAATGHAAEGTKAGWEAAIADLAAAQDVIDRFRDDDEHPNPRDVARAADEALRALRAIEWPVAWWKVPGGNRSGKLWNRGVSITSWSGGNFAAYEREVCGIDAVVGGSDGGSRKDKWRDLCGGPVLGDPSGYDDAGRIENGSQLDWDKGTNFGLLVREATAGKTWLVWAPATLPKSMSTEGKRDADAWARIAANEKVEGARPDDWYYAMGRRARAAMRALGMEDWQLALRFNHEMNQSNVYQVFEETAADYAEASRRFMRRFREGYDDGNGGEPARGRVRMIFSPARREDIGDLESFFTRDEDGGTPYDAVDVSAHPAAELEGLEDRPRDEQKRAVRRWLAGDFKSGYAPLHDDPARSQLALARKYGLPICNTEWSPRYEPRLRCPIPAAVFEAFHEHFLEHADELAFECVFHGNVLDETDRIAPGWADGSRTYKRLWRSSPPEVRDDQGAAGDEAAAGPDGELRPDAA